MDTDDINEIAFEHMHGSKSIIVVNDVKIDASFFMDSSNQ